MNDSASHYRADIARQVLLAVLAAAALWIAGSAARIGPLVLLCAVLVANSMTKPWPMAPPGFRAGKQR